MSISLPKELQTQKINSLDGDLKGIAESLLAEKFGIEEESEPEMAGSFPRDSKCTCGPQYAVRCVLHEPNVHSEWELRVDPRFGDSAWGHYERAIRSENCITTSISLRACIDLLKMMDRRNIPKDNRRFLMGQQEARELMQDPEFIMTTGGYREGVRPTIYGCPIEIVSGEEGSIRLEARF